MPTAPRVNVRARPDRPNLQLAWTDPLTGQVRTRSAGTARWKEAERAAARLESELAQSLGIVACGWDVFRQRFEDEHLARLARSSRENYRSALNHFERLVGRPRQMSSITPSVLSQFRAELSKHMGSEETVHKTLRHLRSAFNWAAKVGLIDRAPAVSIPTLRQSARGRALSTVEFVHMLRAADATGDQRLRDLLLCLWLTGLRLSEAIQLARTPPVQLDDSGRFPAIRFSADGHKARRSEVVPLTPAASRFLARFSAQNGPLLGITGSPREIGRRISAIGRAAGILVSPTKYASAHDLRRSFGRRWALRVHPLVLQRLMRHRTLQTTLAYYVDLDADALAEQLWHPLDVHAARFNRPPNQPRKPGKP